MIQGQAPSSIWRWTESGLTARPHRCLWRWRWSNLAFRSSFLCEHKDTAGERVLSKHWPETS